TNFRVIAGKKNRLRIFGFDCRQLRAEIRVAFAVAFVRNNGPAHFLKVLDKDIRKPNGIVIFDVAKNRDILKLQRVGGELRHDQSLKWIDETYAENVVPYLSHLRIGRGGTDHG